MSPLCKSDHNILDINCETHYTSIASNNIKYNFNKENYTNLVSSLNLDWVEYFPDCVDDIDMWNKYNYIVAQQLKGSYQKLITLRDLVFM